MYSKVKGETMKRTSEELLNFYGLKVGDVVVLDGVELIVKKSNFEGYESYTLCHREPFGDVYKLKLLLDKEYTIIKQPILTEDEKVILRNLPKEYKWIVRDDNGDLFVSYVKPKKYEMQWGWTGVDEVESLSAFYKLFSFIKWEDEPMEISELLK